MTLSCSIVNLKQNCTPKAKMIQNLYVLDVLDLFNMYWYSCSYVYIVNLNTFS